MRITDPSNLVKFAWKILGLTTVKNHSLDALTLMNLKYRLRARAVSLSFGSFLTSKACRKKNHLYTRFVHALCYATLFQCAVYTGCPYGPYVCDFRVLSFGYGGCAAVLLGHVGGPPTPFLCGAVEGSESRETLANFVFGL